MLGKHASETQQVKQLKETIKLKDKEIEDIKLECSEQFKRIYDLLSQNSLGNEKVRIRKIKEIAKDNYIILMKDIFIEKDEKILELPRTNQSKKATQNKILV